MAAITLEIPEDIVARLRSPPARASEELRREFAVFLVREGILPRHQARKLAAMDRIAFDDLLASTGGSNPRQMSLSFRTPHPISCLLRIGRPDLLATVSDPRIPAEVAAELDQGAGGLGDWRSMLPHVQIETVQPMPLLGLLEEEVDAGEAAALALGVSLHADLE